MWILRILLILLLSTRAALAAAVPLPQGKGRSMVLAFSADGQRLLGSSVVWDLARASVANDFGKGGRFYDYAVRGCFFPDGRIALLASPGDKHSLRIVDIATGRVEFDEKVMKATDNYWQESEQEAAWAKALERRPDLNDCLPNVLAGEASKAVCDAVPDQGVHSRIVSADRHYIAQMRGEGGGPEIINLKALAAPAGAAVSAAELDTALKLDAKNVSAYVQRGYLKSAEDDYEATLKKGHPATYYLRTKFEAAAADFSKALELDPGRLTLRLSRGLLRFRIFRLGGDEPDWSAVADDLMVGLAARPGAAADAAELTALVGRLLAIQKAVKANPKDAGALHDRALAKLALGLFDSAVLDLLYAREAGQPMTEPEARMLEFKVQAAIAKAEEFEANGAPGSAADYWDDAASWDPKGPDAANYRAHASANRLRNAEQLKALDARVDAEIKASRAGTWVKSFDLAGVSRAIIAGNSGSSAGSAGAYSAAGADRAHGSAGKSGSPPSPTLRAPDYDSIVNQRLEQKLWDMSDPFKKR